MKILAGRSRLRGKIAVPGSKSHTIRGVVIGTLAAGQSQLLRPLISEDTLSCIEGCRCLGAGIDTTDPAKWMIEGVDGKPKIKKNKINMGNSGTSLRLLASVAALCDQDISFDGDDSLRTRFMKPLLQSLSELGARTQSNHGKCPLKIRGPIHGGLTKIEGITSQFLSSLLITTPLLKEDSVIQVSHLNEKPYVEITLEWLNKQGILVAHENMEIFKVKGGQSYRAFRKAIPADFSTACFPLCAAAITGSDITITGLDFSDLQGDKMIFHYLEKMGLSIDYFPEQVMIRPSALQGIEIDLNATPDALPVLSVAACFAQGKTALVNVPQARFKECDRIAVMTQELRKMGAKIEELPDGMVIHQSSLHSCAELDGHGDHRIVMSLALAGMATHGESIVSTAEAARVTYPCFAEDMIQLGANIKWIE
ncbi:MAG: 3-phosphoshikimate 1-carboxyvinyltransferase [Candidatus Aureabacteria bacterium]|nr:3-phosphoshikimate 1-carboxyvinyltransferase [Candidatus Auribacterota bacterium]